MSGPISWSSIGELRTKINKTPFYKTISMTLINVDKKGSVVELESGRKHRNPWGTVHGGAMASLIDSTCGLAVLPHLKKGETVMTISLHVDYIAPVSKGTITARGKLIHRGRKIARSEAVLTDELGNTAAKGSASFMIFMKSQE